MKRRGRTKPKEKEKGKFTFYFFFGALILFVPVFFLSSALDRTLMPRLLALSIVLGCSTLLIFNKKSFHRWDFGIWRHSIFIALGIYLMLTILSAFFAYNFKESLFDIIKTSLFLSGVGLAVLMLQRTTDWKRKLSILFIVAAAIAVVIGLVQYYKFVIQADTKIMVDGRHVVYKVIGLFSHKNIHSAFLMLLLPFTAYGIIRLEGHWRVAAIITSTAIILLAVLLLTRSVWVGSSAAVLIATILLLVYARNFELKKSWRKIILLMMAVGISGIMGLIVLGDKQDEFSFRNRALSIFDTQSIHNIHRLKVWGSTLDMIREKPLTGTGAGNWKLIAPAYFAHKFNQPDELVWIRPHNDYLWIASEKGLFGLLSYASIFLICFFYLHNIISTKSTYIQTNDRILALLILAGLVVYLFDASFSFPYERTEIQMILMIYLAASTAMFHQVSPPLKKLMPPRHVLLISGLLIFSFSAYFAWSATKMEQHMNRSVYHMNRQEWQQMLHHAHQAKTPLKSNGPLIEPPEFLVGLAYISLNDRQKAMEPLQVAHRLAPKNVRIMVALAQTCYDLGMRSKSIEYLNMIIDLFPAYHEVVVNLSRVYYSEDAFEKALTTLKRYPGWEEDQEIIHMIKSLEEILQEE